MADATTMRAWAVTEPGPVEAGTLRFMEKPVPQPGDGELLVHVRACGVCRTDLHVTEGDLPVRRPGVTPGHEVVGTVAGLGTGVSGFAVGDRGGVLAVAGIHLSDTPPLDYEHELFYEKELRSVTSNTRADAREFLDLTARYHVRATTHTYPLSRAADALTDLKAGRFDGAAVLVNDLNG